MNESFVPSDRESVSPAGAETVKLLSEGEAHKKLREDCLYFLSLAAGLGLVYALCFVEAGGWGVNFVLYALCWVVCAHLSLRRLGLERPRRDGFWYGGIVLLALTIAWTANPFLQLVSAGGGVLLQCFWILNVFADVADWHFGKAAGAVCRLAARAVGRVAEPFRHIAALRKSDGKGKYVLLGLLIAAPLAAAVTALLCSADAVFRALFDRLFSAWRLPDFLRVAGKGAGALLLSGLAFYGALCAQTDAPEAQEQAECGKADTLVAVTFTAVLALIYAVFCAIQVSVLFAGRSAALPEGYTYAQYAREGFFQLLAVSAINVLLVIVSQRRFTAGKVLRALLCVISACTYLMELSSAWRMILYVQVYGFTFLRLLVLWFLAVLSVVLGGALVTVFRPGFRLFRFSLTVCLAGWLVFAFARPDNLAAKYDLQRFGCAEEIMSTIRYDLYADALSELDPYLAENRAVIDKYMDGYLDRGIERQYASAGARGWNYSLWRARRTAQAYRQEAGYYGG